MSSVRHVIAAAALAGAAVVSSGATAAEYPTLETLRFDQLRMEGSHNSYRPYPSAREANLIRIYAVKFWPALAYGHPPLESQLALGLHQFEIDVAPDPRGGAYAAPYADAPSRVRAKMAAPGAKVLHVAGLDTETHCLTFRDCLAVFLRWSKAHPDHAPIVILINSVDPRRLPRLFPFDRRFDQATIDALDDDLREVLGPERVLTPDQLRGSHPTLRDAALNHAWPRLGALRGKFVFVLDGSDAHEAALRNGHASLHGRMMFGWFDEAAPEAAFFNVQDPIAEEGRIRRLVHQGFIVRTRADADTVEARSRDGRRLAAALASGAQIISTDYYLGVPDPEGLNYVADFGGPMLQCDPVTASCGTDR